MVDQFTKGQLFSELWVLTELELPSNQKKSARKHVQETTEISWNARKSELVELVKLQYHYPNDYKWGPMSYCYINLYRSDDYWTLWYVSCASWDISWTYWMVSWAVLDGNIDILAQEPILYGKEMSQDVQETCQSAQETCLGVQEMGT